MSTAVSLIRIGAFFARNKRFLADATGIDSRSILLLAKMFSVESLPVKATPDDDACADKVSAKLQEDELLEAMES